MFTLNIVRFHWIRFIGAVLALLLAILYLVGFESMSLIGFIFIGFYGAVTGIRIQRGNQPASCDLCQSKALMKVEYEHGFSNVRLIVDCPRCGQVVNTSTGGITPGRR